MKHWLAVPALVLGLCLAFTGLAAPAVAKGGNKKQQKTEYEVKVHIQCGDEPARKK